MLQGFLELNLHSRVLRALEAMGFEEPTPVQGQVIPHLLDGKDVIVQAQTGSGKTAAYGIPIAQKVDLSQPKIQALVLSPTRELALQVSVHLSQIGQFLGLRVVPVYGGQSYHHQTRAIRAGAHVVVATPGRLLDLMEQRVISLSNIRILILDEADEMLAMGFQEDVERILDQAPQDRQTALFSATMPQEIIRLANSFLHEPQRVILTKPRAVTVETVEQSYYMVPRPFKIEALTQLLDLTSPQLALVFCATKQMAADLGRELQSRGCDGEAVCDGGRGACVRSRAADPRWLWLHARVPGRALLPRRTRHAHLRRHQRDPTHRDRPQRALRHSLDPGHEQRSATRPANVREDRLVVGELFAFGREPLAVRQPGCRRE